MGFGLRTFAVSKFSSDDYYVRDTIWKYDIWNFFRQVFMQFNFFFIFSLRYSLCLLSFSFIFFKDFVFLFYRFGRRLPLVVAVIIQLIFGLASSFVPWFWLYLIFRFLTALATGGTMITSFVLTMELIGD